MNYKYNGAWRLFTLTCISTVAQTFGVDDTYIFYLRDATYSSVTRVYWMKKEDMLKPEAKFSVMDPLAWERRRRK